MNLLAIKSHLTRLKTQAKLFGIVLLMVISYRLFDQTTATSATMCDRNSYAIKIIDESVTQEPEISSVETVNDPYFRSFIISVTDRILSGFADEMPCQENSDDEPRIDLVFVRLPLVTSGNKPIDSAPSLKSPQSGVVCRIDSPWVKLSIARSPNPLVQAVFVWNERQFLLDQVLLSDEMPGEIHSLPTSVTPLTNRLFEQYAQDYADSEITLSPSGENSQIATTISERIPADVLWLFRQSWQSTRGKFSNIARSTMVATLKRSSENYTNLALGLVDQCLPSTQNSQQHYESILDVREIISLDEYQIQQLN